MITFTLEVEEKDGHVSATGHVEDNALSTAGEKSTMRALARLIDGVVNTYAQLTSKGSVMHATGRTREEVESKIAIEEAIRKAGSAPVV